MAFRFRPVYVFVSELHIILNLILVKIGASPISLIFIITVIAYKVWYIIRNEL